MIVTNKLRCNGAAHREVMPSVEHRSHKGLNNRARTAFTGISPQFRPRRLLTAAGHRLEMTVRSTIWDQVTRATGRLSVA